MFIETARNEFVFNLFIQSLFKVKILIRNKFFVADRLDGLAKKKNEVRPQTMEDFLQVPDYYNMEDTPGKKRVSNFLSKEKKMCN